MRNPVVAEYGTGLLHTSISRAGSGYLWQRGVGPLAPAPFTSATVGRGLDGLAVGGAELIVGREREGDRVYPVRARRSVAAILLDEGPRLDLRPVLVGLGALLAELHRRPVCLDAPPRAVVRLEDWLHGRAAAPRAARAAPLLEKAFGADRLGVLRRWCARLSDGGEPVCSHGAPGLGSLVSDPGSGVGELLAGEDLGSAPWYFDLGWIIGELVELQWCGTAVVEDRDEADRMWNSLIESVFEGYGRDLGTEWERMVALRILLHLHDYTAYVGWHPAAFAQYTHFVGYLVDSASRRGDRRVDAVGAEPLRTLADPESGC